jgi:hypothetical protein
MTRVADHDSYCLQTAIETGEARPRGKLETLREQQVFSVLTTDKLRSSSSLPRNP